MKYLFISLAVIVLIIVAFIKGVSVGDAQTAETDSPCSAESILKTDNPDARFSHCSDHDWNGSALLKNRLTEARNHPTEYGIVCQDEQIRLAILPSVIQPEAPTLISVTPPFEAATAHKQEFYETKNCHHGTCISRNRYTRPCPVRQRHCL